MSTAKKSIVTLAAALITTGFLAPSFAAPLNVDGIQGESLDSTYAGSIECLSVLWSFLGL
jgi:hypothetical protein